MTADPLGISDQGQMTKLNWPKTPKQTALLLARMDSRESLATSDDEFAQGDNTVLPPDLPKGRPIYGRGKGKVIQMIDDEEHLNDFARLTFSE